MATNIAARVLVQIAANTAGLVSGINQANKTLSKFDTALNRIKNTMLGTFGAYAVLHAIQNNVKALADFDREMTQVKVITNSTKAEMKVFEQSALNIGSTTRYAATEVAKLQLEFGRLGFSTREILLSTKATLDLATATGENLPRAAEIAGATLRGFNLDASEMGRVTNVMAKALNESALTLDSFADGMKYVAPVATAVGVSIEETSAMLSVLSDAGIKGTMAGTSLRRIFTLLSKDGGTLQEKMASLAEKGISLANANDEVGLYAQTSLLILTRYFPVIDELKKSMEAAKDEAEDMAIAMNENLATSIDIAKNSMDAYLLSLKEGGGIIKDATDYFADFWLVASNRGFLDAAIRGGVGGIISDILGEDWDNANTARKIREHIKLAEDALGIKAKAEDDFVRAGLDRAGKNKDGLFDQASVDRFATSLKYSKEYAQDQKKITELTKRAGEIALQANEKITKALVDEQEKARLAREEWEKLLVARKKAAEYLLSINAESDNSDAQEYSNDPFRKIVASSFIDNLGLRELLDEDSQKMIEEMGFKYETAFGKAVLGAEKFMETQDMVNDKTMRMRSLAASIADDVGSMFGEMAEGSLTAAEAIQRGASKIIGSLKGIAIAKLAAAEAGKGVGGLIAAVAGLSFLESLFRRAGRAGGGYEGSGYRSGISSSSYSLAQDSSIRITGEAVIKGQDLYIAFKNYSDSKYSTHG